MPSTCMDPRERGARYTGGAVRGFSEADIPGVSDLYCRVLGPGKEGSPELLTALRRYFSRVFLDELWDGDGIGSLVYEDGSGDIAGFLGVVPRRMTMDGERLLAAASTRLVLDERSASGSVGAELLTAFFQQPQDLSIMDGAGEGARLLWESLGGGVAPVHSMQWLRILRPDPFFEPDLGLRAVDAPAVRPLPGEAALVAEEMCAGTFVEQLPALTARQSLRPDDDERTLRWALERVAAQGEWAEPEGVLLRDAQGRPVGAYFHHVDPRGIDQVLQLVAVRSSADDVVGHVVHRAYELGAVAVEGRLDQHVAQALSRHHALYHHRGSWVLVHTKRPEIEAAFDRGEAILSRLEGGLCLQFTQAAETPARPRASGPRKTIRGAARSLWSSLSMQAVDGLPPALRRLVRPRR